MENGWLVTLLLTSAPAAWNTIQQTTSGDPPDKDVVRRSYVHFAIYIAAVGSILTLLAKDSRPLVAVIPIFGSVVLANEYAMRLANVKGN